MNNLYSKVRGEIRTGDLLAWRTTKINSFFDFVLYLYQKILGAQYTHVGIAVRFGDRLFIVEATPPVVRIWPISKTESFYLFKTHIEDNPIHLDYLFKNLGKTYSIFDLLKSLLKIGNHNNEFYCSEYAGDFYNKVGYLQNEWCGLTPDTLVRNIQDVTKEEPIFIMLDEGNMNGV